MKHALLVALLFASVGCAFAQRYPAFIPCFKDGKWGYCDSNRKWLIAAQWDAADLFIGNTAIVYHRVIDSNKPFQVLKHDNPSLINKNGEYIIPPSRGWNGIKDTWVLNARDTATGKWGIIDSNNNVVVPILYDDRVDGTKWIYDNRTKARYFLGRRNGLWGLIDEDQRTVIPFKYHKLEMADTANMVFKTYLFGKNGAVDIVGRTILPAEYTDLRFGWGAWAGGLNGKWGALDTGGKTIVPFIYKSVSPGPDSIVAYNGSVFIYFDKKGKKHRTSKVQSYSGIYQTGDRPYWPRPSDYKELVEPGAGMWRRGEQIHDFVINGKRYHQLYALDEHAESKIYNGFYAARSDIHYENITILVDTALVQRGAGFKYVHIGGVVGDYLLGYRDGYMALFDTNANHVTKWVKLSRLAGYIKPQRKARANDSIFLIAEKWNEYARDYYHVSSPAYNPLTRNDWRAARTVNAILNAAGEPVERFARFKSFRNISVKERAMLGRDDIMFATNEEGYEGIIDANAKTVFPAISFKYKWMDLVGNETNWGAFSRNGGAFSRNGGEPHPDALTNRPLLPPPGSFVVKDDSGRLGYFDTKGQVLNPRFQFVYKQEPRKMGDDLYWLPDDLSYWERDGYRGLIKLVNGKNEDLTPGKKVAYIKLLPWPGLYQVFLQTPDKRNDLNFYISETGRIFGEGGLER